jgi:hypothetical protein
MTDTFGAVRADHPSEHATHDLFVIAAAADRDADAATRASAATQMADCQDCAALFADLRSISDGLTSLPRTIPVTRDFRISPERAARLRSGGWRRLVDGFGRGPSLRPLASAFTALGVAGLLLTVALPTFFSGFSGGSSAAAPAALNAGSSPESDNPAPGEVKTAATAAPGFGSGGASGAEASPDVRDTESMAPQAIYGQPTPVDGGGRSSDTAVGGGQSPPPSALAIAAWISLVLLVAGLGLFVVSRVRVRDPAG